jgi:excisionase family DNA binding protein
MANAPNEYNITAEELARRLDCAKSTVYAMAKSGAIPCVAVGVNKTGVRFDYAEVLEALKK